MEINSSVSNVATNIAHVPLRILNVGIILCNTSTRWQFRVKSFCFYCFLYLCSLKKAKKVPHAMTTTTNMVTCGQRILCPSALCISLLFFVFGCGSLWSGLNEFLHCPQGFPRWVKVLLCFVHIGKPTVNMQRTKRTQRMDRFNVKHKWAFTCDFCFSCCRHCQSVVLKSHKYNSDKADELNLENLSSK